MSESNDDGPLMDADGDAVMADAGDEPSDDGGVTGAAMTIMPMMVEMAAASPPASCTSTMTVGAVGEAAQMSGIIMKASS